LKSKDYEHFKMLVGISCDKDAANLANRALKSRRIQGEYRPLAITVRWRGR
jgi:hypothetical protein